ncbi:response regulator transcription factor [Mucilaginibacter corticis]|uniref:Response regulator transcription factor n=1 Tax=Mucilaginibacter corticis TaxID=2597670 RepID=A0A556M9D7_9SPHI|nr:response regulator [Mucilaginibacter corticis]TSJ36534.1 response regulator transcription factor [Mucilaginibacter corticis]
MGKRILVLDDDQHILDILTYILTEDAYEVKVLADGHQVAAAIEQFDPALILMDVMLADLDGWVICRHLKERPETSHIPVILISGTHDLAATLHQQGAPNDFMTKPFDLDVLLSKIKAQLV